MSFGSPENWIDAELRRVPLPPGLAERLRAASELNDDDIDAALVAVSVPAALEARLLEIVADEPLDLRLCDVALPAEFSESLETIPYEDALRDVPAPADLLVSLRRIVPPRRRWSPAQMALAASLLLLLGSAYVASVVGWMATAYNASQPMTATVLMLPDRALRLTSSPNIPVTLAFDEQTPRRRHVSSPAIDDPFSFAVDTRPIPEQLAAVFPAGYDLADDTLPLRYRILGENATAADRVADLEVLALAEPRGVAPPISAGFDRHFLVKHRTQPIVALAGTTELHRQTLPLWRKTDSFELLRERSAAGRLPAAHEIAVEDFLAAMQCQFAPADAGRVAIRAAAGPSIFGDGEASLLQIGVQAGPRARTTPLHVTLAIDTSDSMRWSGRLERVQQALRRFAAQMSAEDRLSLVIYRDAADARVEDASRAELATIYEAIDALSAHGGSNFGAGLQQAAMAADSPAAVACGRRRIVLIADELPPLSVAAHAQADRLLGELNAAGVAVDVVDIDAADRADAQLAAVAAAAGQKLIVAGDADALLRQLIERTTGASPEIARAASVEIAFNPQSVKAYRLLGHEAVALGGVPAAIESSLLAGEAATVLLEVWLAPSGPAHVADVHVRWTDAVGEAHVERQQVRRVQFVPSFVEAPLSLQAAAVAAEAAEALRQSPFSAAREQDLRPVLAVAGEVNPRLAQRTEFQRFVAVLRQAEQARRGGAIEKN